MRNASFSCSRTAQVHLHEMALQVHKLKDQEQDHTSCEKFIRSPRWSCVVRMQEKVHRHETEREPVVERVLENICPRHRVQAESMDKDCFKLPLKVVNQHHRYAQLLIVRIVFYGLAVDLFLIQR